MRVDGCLLEAMQEVISSVAVLVVDESGYTDEYEDEMEPDDPYRSNFAPIKDITACQQRVIMLAQAYNRPIIFSQYDLALPIGSYHYAHDDDKPLSKYPAATKKSLRALLPHNTRVINKHSPNAFLGTNLSLILAQQNNCAGIEYLVVMGWNSTVCIPATIGPQIRYNEDCCSGRGAVDHGLTVLTSQYVLNGSPAWWIYHSDQIEFYAYL